MRSTPGQRVVIVDDLLATGRHDGTPTVQARPRDNWRGEVVGLGFAIELDFLKGRSKFPKQDVFSLLHYDD